MSWLWLNILDAKLWRYWVKINALVGRYTYSSITLCPFRHLKIDCNLFITLRIKVFWVSNKIISISNSTINLRFHQRHARIRCEECIVYEPIETLHCVVQLWWKHVNGARFTVLSKDKLSQKRQCNLQNKKCLLHKEFLRMLKWCPKYQRSPGLDLIYIFVLKSKDQEGIKNKRGLCARSMLRGMCG